MEYYTDTPHFSQLTPPTASKPSSLETNLIWQTYHLLPYNSANSQPRRPTPLHHLVWASRSQLSGYKGYMNINTNFFSASSVLYSEIFTKTERNYQKKYAKQSGR